MCVSGALRSAAIVSSGCAYPTGLTLESGIFQPTLKHELRRIEYVFCEINPSVTWCKVGITADNLRPGKNRLAHPVCMEMSNGRIENNTGWMY